MGSISSWRRISAILAVVVSKGFSDYPRECGRAALGPQLMTQGINSKSAPWAPVENFKTSTGSVLCGCYGWILR